MKAPLPTGTAALLGLLLVGPPALAHGDEGEMTVVTAEQSGPAGIRVEVGIVFSSDGHLAEGATVAATATGPGGATIGPADVPRIRGARYGATLEGAGPGEWTVTVISTEPEAEASALVTVAAIPATTAPAPPTTVPPTPPITGLPESTGTSSADPDAGSAPWQGAAAALLMLGALGGYGAWRRRRRA